MNRTQQQIIDRIEARKANDFIGFEISDYIDFLDFEHVKPYLKENVTADQWKQEGDPKAAMIEYMPFAWEKANNCRGISACRSLSHYMAWLWLDGNEELANDIADYEYYGKPQLVKICEYLGIDSNRWDDGVRVNSEEELED